MSMTDALIVALRRARRAGVASSISAVATMPIDFLVVRRSASAIVSTRGSSRVAGVRSA